MSFDIDTYRRNTAPVEYEDLDYGAFEAAHGIATGEEHIRAVRARLGRRDRLSPIRQAIVANLFGADFIAVHMTFGAINEWSTLAGYARLAALENHPVLTELLTRIMRQETRHIAFYTTQARERLRRSVKARRLTRFALRAFWSPVGSSVMPEAETRHLLAFLLGGEAGGRILAHLDERIDKLPGLAGLRLMTRAMARYGEGSTAATRTGGHRG